MTPSGDPAADNRTSDDVLRVAVDVGALRGPRTGVSNSISWALDALAERTQRSENDVVASPYATSLRSSAADGERRIPIPATIAHRLWALPWSPPVDRWLGEPDVVHGTNYVVPPARAARVVTIHDCWFLENPQLADPGLSPIAAALRRAIETGAHVLTCSDATSERVRDLFDARSVSTLHHGPPPATATEHRTAPNEGDPSAPFVLALGTVERRKNIPTLVRAFRRVADEHPSIELRIAGRDGDDGPAVAAAIGELPPEAQRRVIRHTDVDDATKHWLLEHAQVLAYPSLDEGFGFPILEAQQAGAPVVASTAGSIPEVAGDGAVLCAPLDTSQLADNVLSVMQSEAVRVELVSLGHSNVRRFSWERNADELTDHYRRIATDR